MTLAGFSRISVAPLVYGGRPVVTGTRVRAKDVVGMLPSGATPAEIAADFAYLSEDDVRAVLAYAAAQRYQVLGAHNAEPTLNPRP